MAKTQKNDENKVIACLSSLSDEVFTDGLNSPELAKLLCSLRNIEAQFKDLFKVNEKTKKSQIKVTESLDALSKKINELETEIKNKDEKNPTFRK